MRELNERERQCLVTTAERYGYEGQLPTHIDWRDLLISESGYFLVVRLTNPGRSNLNLLGVSRCSDEDLTNMDIGIAIAINRAVKAAAARRV